MREHVAGALAQPRAQHVDKGRRVGVVGGEEEAQRHAAELARLEVRAQLFSLHLAAGIAAGIAPGTTRLQPVIKMWI